MTGKLYDEHGQPAALRVAPDIMVLKSLRVPESLWIEAQAIARDRDESISEVLRAALTRYVKRHS